MLRLLLMLFILAPLTNTREILPCRTAVPREAGQWITLDHTKLRAGETLTLDLYDTTFTVVNTQVEPRPSGHTGHVWYGIIPEVEGGSVVLVVEGERIHGRISASGYRYLISPLSDDLYEVTQMELDDTDGIGFVPTSDPVEAHRTARVDDGSRIDILVVYTAGAKSIMERVAGSPELVIDGAISHTNMIFEGSGITTRLNLVHLAPVFYLEQPNVDFMADLHHLMGKEDGYLDEVHTLRDQYRADLVMMISGVWFASYSGKAPTPAPLHESKGFSITEACNITDTTFTQQIGFNLGSTHDPTNAVNLPPVQPYGYGYQDVKSSADDYGDFVTVMAKRTGGECPPIVTANQCVIIERFSNPNQTINGKPIGSINADNVRSINDLAVVVANYRASDGTLPPTPVSTPTNVPIPSELVINGGFEIDADRDTVPDFWQGKRLGVGDGVVCENAYEGACAFTFKGAAGEKSSLTYRMDVSAIQGRQSLTLSAAVWGKKVREGGEVRLIVRYADKTKEVLRLPIPTGTYDYTLLSGNQRLSASKEIESAKIQIRYRNNEAGGKWRIDRVRVE